MFRNWFIFGFITVLSCSTASKTDSFLQDQEGTPLTNELAASTQVGGHGMVIFGKDTLYMYHLPMWEGLHAWQIVIEVELDREALAVYSRDRAAGSQLNTLSPRSFALASLAPGFTFRGTLFHGHFEQGGQALSRTPATVTVKRIVMVTPLAPDLQALAVPTFRLFGHGDEWYAAHVASSRPNFDQVLQLTAVPETFTEAQLNTGMKLTTPDRSDAVEQRLAVGQNFRAQVGETAVQLIVASEAYFSTTDLGE